MPDEDNNGIKKIGVTLTPVEGELGKFSFHFDLVNTTQFELPAILEIATNVSKQQIGIG